MPVISGLLDLALSIVCLGIATWGARRRNDFLVLGFVWVAAAACAGAFNLGGFKEAAPTHQFLTLVSSGIGTLMMAIGVLAAIFGPLPGGSWLAPVVAIFGAGGIHHLKDWSHVSELNLGLGSVFLISLIILAIVGFQRGRLVATISAVISLGAILIVGFVLPKLQFSDEMILKRVDIVHLFLITCYSFLWLGIRSICVSRSE
ncbi:hypothetical protein K2Y11_18960 [bacterium]|nr:hypothetical protein [bacterium]